MATYESKRYAISGANVTGINAANIADGSVTNAEFQTVDTDTSISTQLGTKISASGGTITSNGISFDDDIKAKFGAGDDLTIHHDDTSNTSFITETGSGPLHIRGNNVVLKSQTDNDDFVKCVENGAVEIYYSNSKKFETVTGGATVTGTLAATAVTGDGSALTSLNASNISSGTLANARGGHNYTLSTSDPSGGVNGDVWYKY